MGYFTIHLPGHRKGDVRYGPVKKMKTISHRFRRKNFDNEQMAYIVRVDAGFANEQVYYLVKTEEGHWLNEMKDASTAVIRNAIDQYQHQLLSTRVEPAMA